MRPLKKNERLVVGIDAAMSNMGFVKVIVDASVPRIVEVVEVKLVKTEPQDKKTVRRSSDRIRRGRELLQEMRNFCYGTCVSIAEVPEGSQTASVAWTLGVVTGILCACPNALVEVSPREVKMASVGKPTASKEEMRQWAYTSFPNAPWRMRGGKPLQDNEHLADALASVAAGIRTQQFRGMAGMWSVQEIMEAPFEDEPQPRRRLKR